MALKLGDMIWVEKIPSDGNLVKVAAFFTGYTKTMKLSVVYADGRRGSANRENVSRRWGGPSSLEGALKVRDEQKRNHFAEKLSRIRILEREKDSL